MSFVSNLAHSLVIEWKMSTISHEKQNEWHKKNRFIHQNVLPDTNWQNVTKSCRTNRRTNCQQNRIAISRQCLPFCPGNAAPDNPRPHCCSSAPLLHGCHTPNNSTTRPTPPSPFLTILNAPTTLQCGRCNTAAPTTLQP